MKKKLAMIFAAMLILLAAAPTAYGAGLEVTEIFPKTDSTGLQTVNQMARIYFSGDIDIKANEDCFKIVDPDGKAQKIMVLEQPEEPNRVNLVLEGDLKENTEYTIQIDGALTDTAGNTLGQDYTSSFKTRSQRTDSIVTTVMMVLMFGAVIVFTLRDQRKQQEEQEERDRRAGKEKKVNPYKEAKKKGGKGKTSQKKENPMSNTRQRANQIQADRKKKRREKVDQIMKENQKKNKRK